MFSFINVKIEKIYSSFRPKRYGALIYALSAAKTSSGLRFHTSKSQLCLYAAKALLCSLLCNNNIFTTIPNEHITNMLPFTNKDVFQKDAALLNSNIKGAMNFAEVIEPLIVINLSQLQVKLKSSKYLYAGRCLYYVLQVKTTVLKYLDFAAVRTCRLAAHILRTEHKVHMQC